MEKNNNAILILIYVTIIKMNFFPTRPVLLMRGEIMGKPVIIMEKVNKAFLPGVRVIDNLSFSVQKGEIIGILGPNGAGKTTTIRLLNGVLYPDTGRISVAGFDPVSAGDEVRKRCGVLTESAGLYEHMTARENLLFFAELYGVAEPVRQAERLLSEFGLADAARKKVGAFSTGMKKRLGIRSEERRVGKGCRSPGSPQHQKNKGHDAARRERRHAEDARRRRQRVFFFSSRRRHTRCGRDWSSDVCSSDLPLLCRALRGCRTGAAGRKAIIRIWPGGCGPEKGGGFQHRDEKTFGDCQGPPP